MSCAATTSKATPNLRPNPDQCRSLLPSCWYHQRHAEELYCAASSQKLLDSFAHGWTGALRLRCADYAAVEKEQVQVCLCTPYLNHTYIIYACVHALVNLSIYLSTYIYLAVHKSKRLHHSKTVQVLTKLKMPISGSSPYLCPPWPSADKTVISSCAPDRQ